MVWKKPFAVFLVIASQVVAFVQSQADSDYCSITRKHTMCQYQVNQSLDYILDQESTLCLLRV